MSEKLTIKQANLSKDLELVFDNHKIHWASTIIMMESGGDGFPVIHGRYGSCETCTQTYYTPVEKLIKSKLPGTPSEELN